MKVLKKRLKQTQGRSSSGRVMVEMSDVDPKFNAKPRAGSEVDERPFESVDADWIELFPHGITVTSSIGRPVLVLKDQQQSHVLPVWMNPIDAGVALQELANGNGASPHMVVRQLMERLGIKVESCAFVDLIGHHQYVLLTFKASKGIELGIEPGIELAPMRLRAEEAMSFCLQSRAKFFSTQAYMARCRDVDADMEKLESRLATGSAPHNLAALEAENSSKKHPYVM